MVNGLIEVQEASDGRLIVSVAWHGAESIILRHTRQVVVTMIHLDGR